MLELKGREQQLLTNAQHARAHAAAGANQTGARSAS